MTETLAEQITVQQLLDQLTKPHLEAEPKLAFLNQGQLAERLDVTPRILKEWRTSGEDPPYAKTAKSAVLYPVGALLDWEQQLKVVRRMAG